MTREKLKIIVLTHDCPNRLLELLAALKTVELVGIFVETVTSPQRSLAQKIKRSVRYDGYMATFKKFAAKLFAGKTNNPEKQSKNQTRLKKCAANLNVPLHYVGNYHAETTKNLLRQANADLGILYGTNIIKESVFSIPRLGSINLHQGLAPFYRGGPTVFWELFNDEKELGITVHFVAEKVDTGDIILQKTFSLDYDFTQYGLDFERFLNDYRTSLIEPSVQLLMESVTLISTGQENRRCQDTSLGKRYRLPVKQEKDELLRRLRERQKKLQV